ncbi:MAG TPA: hypothetical protein VFS87_11325 [Qipengyuania sp.]|nr:hypothetical protein [Qipengyuania sp.]
MYIGHFAPALAAGALSPDAPRLGTLFVAAQLVDLAFFALLMLGVEDLRVVPGITAMNPLDLYHMPYTHSLVGTALWGIGFGVLVWRRTGIRAAGAWAAMVVLSHWLIDLIAHRPDLTLAGSPPKLGLGLWDYPLVAMPLELGLVALAFWFYLRRTRGPLGPALILLAVLLLFQAVNWFGPQPTEYSVALPLMALLSYTVLIALARWVGTTRRHRRAVGLAMGRLRR